MIMRQLMLCCGLCSTELLCAMDFTMYNIGTERYFFVPIRSSFNSINEINQHLLTEEGRTQVDASIAAVGLAENFFDTLKDRDENPGAAIRVCIEEAYYCKFWRDKGGRPGSNAVYSDTLMRKAKGLFLEKDFDHKELLEHLVDRFLGVNIEEEMNLKDFSILNIDKSVLSSVDIW